MSNFDTYIQKDFRLPSPPAIATRILEAVRDARATSRTLSKIISSDPALAARILKFTNSSLNSSFVKIDSIDRAVTVLGTENLKNIALSFAIAKPPQGEQASRFDYNQFWKRSLTTAVGSNLLAEKMGMDQGISFVAGLLKDIGMLYMYLAKPEDYLDVFQEQMSNNLPLVESERAIFGFDHQEIGAAILEHWSFPDQICRPIRFHHRIMDAPISIREETRLLSLADKVSSAYHGCNTISRVKEINSAFYRNEAIRDEAVTAFMDQVGEQSLEILSSFDMDPGGMKPYSQMLQEASEELGKLNLSYEQLTLDLKQARKKSDQLAAEVKKANDRIRLLALRDGLTGLYNHTYFQNALVKEISRARRYKRTLSLIILDIDHFNSVNHAFGHLIGDKVLRRVAEQIKKSIRNADIAARCEGEKFALILPETHSKGALILAERLRNIIEEMPLSSDGSIDFSITISAGVATYDPSRNNTITTVEMVQYADRGLYFAKKSGRNRVDMFRNEN